MSNNKISVWFQDMRTLFWSSLKQMAIISSRSETPGEAEFGKVTGLSSRTDGAKTSEISSTTTSVLKMVHSTWAWKTFWSISGHLSFVKSIPSICTQAWSFPSSSTSQITWGWKYLKAVDTFCHFTRKTREKWKLSTRISSILLRESS